MILTLLAYFCHPPTREVLTRLASLKQETGFLFSFVSAVIAGAVLPEILAIVVFQKGRVTRQNLNNLAFGTLFWGSQGMCVDLFYRGQALWFGTGSDAATIAKKVLLDQLVYTPFYASPVSVAIFEWRSNGFRFRGLSHVFTWRFYTQNVFPTQVANWCLWVPVTSMVYSLPSLLQIPLFSFGLCFWVMIFTWMTRKQQLKDAVASAR